MLTTDIKAAIQRRRMIDVLLSGNIYADLVLKGGYIINVVTREIYAGDVAIQGDRILLVGQADKLIGPLTVIEDVTGQFISPGFIDSHMHFESAMLTVTEFSKLSIPTGTTTLVADPHEIGNVLGVQGMKAMIEEAKTLPNRVLFTVPCLTPDVPGLETAGADISSKDMQELLNDDYVQGIGELQGFSNVHPVYRNAPYLIDDLLASVSYAKSIGKSIEGNAPGLFGPELAAHIICGGGHVSCHETTTKEEMMEKLRYGVSVFMREGSSQRNMAECIRAITEEGMDSRRAILVSDDMVPEDLLNFGHMNDIVRRTIAVGLDPVEAIQMVTINPATHFGFDDIGLLAPGTKADIAVISDLSRMSISQVYIAGVKVAEHGELTRDIPSYIYPVSVKKSVKRKPVKLEELQISAEGAYGSVLIRTIEVVPDQNLTGAGIYKAAVKDGVVQPSVAEDLLPLLVIERHGRSGKIGKTFVRGMKLQSGAIAESVAHDTHNIIVTGTNYADMVTAVNRVIAMDGGIAMIRDGKVVGDLPLRIGGLMTDELTGKEMSSRITELHRLAREELGCTLHVPFMHLSFLSLVTSPAWKITDIGLIDVDAFTVLPTLA
ncbi:adenine deaminase [Paenibacillus donghaensis]|uniref:Adenine deaminase n=1 Tax=Paenibacillus donghaensis TaxID=414771 RepID=A0A2Z2KDN8_9BACL|nr:adenine deaminase C-terminal domain-containing protein [Paenibacillus donghaensis]ASA24114.1 adenosine deaminase [Paenibacillus donghaensis]